MQENNPTRVQPASVSAALAAARAEASATLAAGSLAAANFSSGNPASGDRARGVRFPGEDGGRSLAEMAQRDLDAALQLLADRAQYITGASGAAIALRRNGKNDMLCRASAGSNAPELGALLSTEFGLSGESVRTRQALRCDDAERDARVNREVCRQLGIASVVVMPVVNDDEVLGVFELFSGQANAFGARDVSAIQRLSEMVETAVRLARAAENLPERLMREISGPELREVAAEEVGAGEVYVEVPEDEILDGQVVGDLAMPDLVLHDARLEDEESVLEVAGEEVSAKLSAAEVGVPEAGSAEAESAEQEKDLIAAAEKPAAKIPALSQETREELAAVAENAVAAPEVAPPQAEPVLAAETALPRKKTLFWSAALNPAADTGAVAEPDQSHVPPVLRSLHKCEACGFPVSAGRVLCVECEEKKWRGQLRLATPRRGATPGKAASASAAKAEVRAFAAGAQSGAASATAPARQRESAPVVTSGGDATALPAVKVSKENAALAAAPASGLLAREAGLEPAVKTLESPSAVRSREFVLSAGLEPSQSWLAANKYIVGVLLLVAAAGAAFFLLR